VTRRLRAQQYIREQTQAGHGPQLSGKEVAEAIGMDSGQARAILIEMRSRGECPARPPASNGTQHSHPDPLREYFRRVVQDGYQITLHRGDEVRDVIVLF
jgi:hypothetical protein